MPLTRTWDLQEMMERPPADAAPLEGRTWADIRKDFDILDQNVQLKPLVYLDSAATSQKPKEVVAKMSDYYRRSARHYRPLLAAAELHACLLHHDTSLHVQAPTLPS